MAHDPRIDIEEREALVESERGGESVEQFVDELLTYENRSTERQGVTIEIDGQTYRPYLFTKGMPLDGGGSDPGTPRPEGVVAPYRKIENYRCAYPLSPGGMGAGTGGVSSPIENRSEIF